MLMKITQSVLTIHQLTVEEYQAFELVEKVLSHIQDSYGAKCVLMSPNTGEVVEIGELPRVRGVLDFLVNNRVVEVEAKL